MASLGAPVATLVSSTSAVASTTPLAGSSGSTAAPATQGINLGYCCLNTALRAQKPSCYTNRTCVLKTFRDKGLPHVSALALLNARDLLQILQWNEAHGIRLFRVSSELVPWFSEFALAALPDWPAVSAALLAAGDYARSKQHRLTMHPGPHIVLGAPDAALAARSAFELEQHAALFDAMGYEASFANKLNIHVRAVYLPKSSAPPTPEARAAAKRLVMDRFAERWRALSPGVRGRLTVENDDTPNAYSVDDLAYLHGLTGIPIVFDAHHQRFCSGAMSAEAAFLFALRTWPAGVRPVVHWSESQAGRKPLAHSDWIAGPVRFFGREAEVDCMLEVKEKEQALLRYRDGKQ